MSARLPNGLTPEQDAAFDALARALAEHLTANPTTEPRVEETP